MRITNKLLFLMLIPSFYGCEQNEIAPETDAANEIAFQIEQTNSNNDYTSNAESLTVKRKSSEWFKYDGKIHLTRKILFDLKLENGETVEFGLQFTKYETDQNLLVLMDEELNYWERNWNYVTLEMEAQHFYNEFDEASIFINNNVVFYQQMDNNFDVVKIERAMVNGEEKNYLTINFNGQAFGWYDPKGEISVVYKLSNGTFKGIIE